MIEGLLLDTCAAIWIGEDQRLSKTAIAALDQAADSGVTTQVSPISAWELGLLTARGRLTIKASPEVWFDRLLGTRNIELANMTPNILIAASYLVGNPPNDPADRIIIATAREHGLTIVTRDRLILDYADAGHVRALAC